MIFISPLGRAPGGGGRERSGSTRKASSPPFSLALSLSFFSFLPGAFVCVAGLMSEGGRGRRWRRRSATVFVCIAKEREGSEGEEKQRDCSRGESTYVAASSLMPLPLLPSRVERRGNAYNDQRVCMLYLLQLGPRKKGRLGDRREGGGGEEGRRKEGEKIWNTSSYSSPDPRYGRVSAQARRKKEEGRARMELPGLERITCRSAGDMHLGAKFVSRRCDSIWNQGSRVLCNN